MAANAVPDGYHTVTPYLVVPGLVRLLDFLRRAFGAETLGRLDRPDGGVMHAQVRIGDSIVMMGEPLPGSAPMPATLYLHVADCDALYRRAMLAGATSERRPQDQFYGDRNAGVRDPSGNRWWIATRLRNLTAEEISRRAKAQAKAQAKPVARKRKRATSARSRSPRRRPR